MQPLVAGFSAQNVRVGRGRVNVYAVSLAVGRHPMPWLIVGAVVVARTGRASHISAHECHVSAVHFKALRLGVSFVHFVSPSPQA
jgi:hypothetical protein